MAAHQFDILICQFFQCFSVLRPTNPKADPTFSCNLIPVDSIACSFVLNKTSVLVTNNVNVSNLANNSDRISSQQADDCDEDSSAKCPKPCRYYCQHSFFYLIKSRTNLNNPTCSDCHLRRACAFHPPIEGTIDLDCGHAVFVSIDRLARGSFRRL